MGPGEHVYKHCINAIGRWVQTCDGHVRGGIAQFAPPLFTVDHRAFDPVPVAQHPRGFVRRTRAKGGADVGRADLGFALCDKRGDGHGHARSRT